MQKIKFNAEYEINASPKMLYPYLSTPTGLKEWFADDVNLNEDKTFAFMWDGIKSKALKSAQKTNMMVKFEFTPTDSSNKDIAYLDLRLEENDLTQTSFLKVVDYSEASDLKELESLWENLIDNLRAAVGANKL